MIIQPVIQRAQGEVSLSLLCDVMIPGASAGRFEMAVGWNYPEASVLIAGAWAGLIQMLGLLSTALTHGLFG